MIINIILPEVLTNKKTAQIGQYYHEAAKHFNFELNFISRNKLIQRVDDESINLKTSPGGVINVLLRVSPYFRLQGSIYSINNQEKIDKYKSKYNSIKTIKNYINTPKTLICHQLPTEEMILQNFQFPIIVKPDIGSQGIGVELCNDYQEVQKHIEENHHYFNHNILIQEYIKASHGKDLRIISVKGNPITAMLRENYKNFKANLHQGATGKKYKINDEIKKISQQIYKLTGIDFCGIDLLFGKDGFVFNEVNLFPGLGIIFVTGKNILVDVFELFKN